MAREPFRFLAWDLVVPGVGEVWLRCEDATGHPTQTWVNGDLLEREPEGEFEWAVPEGVPLPVCLMDRTSVMYPGDPELACWLITSDVERWDQQAGDSSYADPYRARCAAYAHYGRTLLLQLECH